MWVRWILVALVVLGGARAWSLRWVCDDAFVSFRYAQNLAEGLGLVYNPGERVEGYTNLSWTLLLAGFVRIGSDPVPASEALGLLFHLALAGVLAARAWGLHRSSGAPFLPLAAALLLVLEDAQVWATGGLETSLFSFLSVVALLAVSRVGRATASLVACGLLLALVVLTRPDGALFAGVAIASFALPGPDEEWGGSLGRAVRVALPLGLSVGAFLAWKLAYYGSPFPTAYYSKSASDPYWSQGFVYAFLFLARNWFLPVVLTAVAVLSVREAIVIRARPRWLTRETSVLLVAGLVFAAYVTRTGGDFMHARRLMPVLPFLLLVLEDFVRARLPRRAAFVAAAICIAAAALPYPVFSRSRARIAGVADERLFYPEEAIAARRRQGEVVGAALAGTGARVMFSGGMLSFGYYSRLPYLVEMTGLTQYSLARRPIRERGHVGHEKVADAAWLTENRIHLVVLQDFPPVPRPAGELPLDEVVFEDVARARIWTYSEEVMDALAKRPGVALVPLETALSRIRSGRDGSGADEAARLLSWLDRASLQPGSPARAGIAEIRRLLQERVQSR